MRRLRRSRGVVTGRRSRSCMSRRDDPSGVGLLTIGSSHERRVVEAPGLRDLQPAPLVGRRLDRIQRQSGQACARAGVRRQSRGIRRRSARKTGSSISQDGEAPSWSPDASLLYFWSDRDGSPCLWAQRLDPATKRPTGAPLSIQHFHSQRAVVEEPVPRRAGYCRRPRQDCLQPGRTQRAISG